MASGRSVKRGQTLCFQKNLHRLCAFWAVHRTEASRFFSPQLHFKLLTNRILSRIIKKRDQSQKGVFLPHQENALGDGGGVFRHQKSGPVHRPPGDPSPTARGPARCVLPAVRRYYRGRLLVEWDCFVLPQRAQRTQSLTAVPSGRRSRTFLYSVFSVVKAG